jgi:two-component system, sensor histidine kinase and response regulator
VALGVLEGFGMQVVIAGDGRQAVEMLARDPAFDLVLMDVQMPVMDGYSATRAIRADARLARLPIVALTADALASERARCLAGGMDEYVTKPISPDHLREVLERVVSHRSPVASQAQALGAIVAPARPETTELPRSSPPTTVVGPVESLPGIDFCAGLRRLMGNRSLYARLLRGFADEHGGDAEQIRAALVRGDAALARSTAHKLKGVAANLSAKQVAFTAGRVESMIREGDRATAEAELEGLAESMRVVRTSVATLIQREPSGMRSVA